jgi:hypothetical protein
MVEDSFVQELCVSLIVSQRVKSWIDFDPQQTIVAHRSAFCRNTHASIATTSF